MKKLLLFLLLLLPAVVLSQMQNYWVLKYPILQPASSLWTISPNIISGLPELNSKREGVFVTDTNGDLMPVGKDLFELDSNGDFMPTTDGTDDLYYELDANNNIQPK